MAAVAVAVDNKGQSGVHQATINTCDGNQRRTRNVMAVDKDGCTRCSRWTITATVDDVDDHDNNICHGSGLEYVCTTVHSPRANTKTLHEVSNPGHFSGMI